MTQISEKATTVERRWWLQLRRADQGPLGDPSKVTKWLKDSTGGHLASVAQVLRCCFCWRGWATGGKGAHTAAQCTWLATFNKLRDNASLAPFAVLEGSLRLGAQKKDVSLDGLAKDFQREKKEVRGELSKLDKRVTTLEPPKRKRQEEAKPGSSTAAATGEPLTKKQRKAAKRAAKKAEKAKQAAASGAGKAATTQQGGGGSK